MKIEINKFKRINNLEVELEPLNIFIGANNSGKSSFIQGIQFAVSSCQTLTLAKANWSGKGTRTLSFDSTEFLYTPTKDVSLLYHGEKLAGSRTRDTRKKITFKFESSESSSLISISKGKNGGFTTLLTGKVLGEELGSIDTPYCVYVPGIAGIPVTEKYEVPISVKKSATRGDSNNFLRNILHTISHDKEKWAKFTKSVCNIYGEIDFQVLFDGEKSEFIEVTLTIKQLEDTIQNIKLPLDLVGTGLLQVVQIFAYIEYFSPKILLLDEPDSHLHPTKQRLLAKELSDRAKENDELKVVFSTHSRYILDSLENEAKIFHFSGGSAIEGVKGSNILVDIGAADADYLFAKRHLKYVLATEDKVDNIFEKKEFLKKFLIANGLSEDEFVLHSYEGCTKIYAAEILQGFIQKQIPNAKVIIHLDRDQRPDDDRDLTLLKDKSKNAGVGFFVTHFQEIESYFCQPKHIHHIFGIELSECELVYEGFVSSLKNNTIFKIKDFLLNERPDLVKKENSNLTDSESLERLAKEC